MRKVLTLAALAAALAAGGCGGGKNAARSPAKGSGKSRLHGAADLARRFGGLAQGGRSLGSPDAPYTLVEFADMQCPFCAAYDRELLPKVLDRYVRRGRLRLEIRLVAFLGPDSATLASAAAAAELQDRVWQFADLVYRNQGRENSGFATPGYIGAIAAAVPGLDLDRFRTASNTAALRRILLADAQAARTAAITGTPGFRLGRTGGVLGHVVDRGNLLAELERTVR